MTITKHQCAFDKKGSDGASEQPSPFQATVPRGWERLGRADAPPPPQRHKHPRYIREQVEGSELTGEASSGLHPVVQAL